MLDREVNIDGADESQIPEELMENLVYALEEGKKVLESATHGESFAPFTAIVVDDKVYMQPYPQETADESFDLAEKCVADTENLKTYAFCYDGFIETDTGKKDAIIAEGGVSGSEVGHAIALIYEQSCDEETEITTYAFPNDTFYLGFAPNFA